MTNLVQFPGLGLSFEINRVALSIGGFNIYWVWRVHCLWHLSGAGICVPPQHRVRRGPGQHGGRDPDRHRAGYCQRPRLLRAMAPFKYESIWEMIAIRDGGLAIYGGIIGGFLFGAWPASGGAFRCCPCST